MSLICKPIGKGMIWQVVIWVDVRDRVTDQPCPNHKRLDKTGLHDMEMTVIDKNYPSY
jgi:hypothetical protein